MNRPLPLDSYRSNQFTRRLYQEDLNTSRAVPGFLISPQGRCLRHGSYAYKATEFWAQAKIAIEETDKLLSRL